MINLQWSYLKLSTVSFLVTVSLLMAGCSTFVAPYDEKLVTDTEAFYKKAAKVIEEGRATSPRTDSSRAAIRNPASHKAHFSNFEPKYNDLVVDAEALILRGMASSEEVDVFAQSVQQKLEELIEAEFPSQCEDLARDIGQASLTVQNFIDLKCIIIKWKEQHSDPSFTRNTLILKKVNWEGRKQTLFGAVLAIQKAEVFKKSESKSN